MADLLDAINNEALRTSSFAFVDDTHILTYGNSTERNCRTLERIHREYKEWSRIYGAKFTPKKYKLIHFAKRPKDFNIRTTIRIGEAEKITTDYIRVLGVQVDSKLKWGLYIIRIKKKFIIQSFVISRISTSI